VTAESAADALRIIGRNQWQLKNLPGPGMQGFDSLLAVIPAILNTLWADLQAASNIIQTLTADKAK